MLAVTNPTFLAGKLAYWEGVPIDAINHCSPDIVASWSDGWHEARAEHMQLLAQITGDRRRVLSEHRDSVL